VDLGVESLSRILTTEDTEHTETILAPVMPCFRGFGVFRGSPIFGDKSQYMVAAPAFRVGRGATKGESRVRLFGFSPAVATCRQTVDALLAPLPPLGSGWLQFGSGWLRFESGRFAFPPILFVRNPPANRPNHRENRYNPEDWQHFL